MGFFVHEFDKCIVFSKDGAKIAEGFVHEYESSVMKIYTQGERNDSITPFMEVFVYVYNSVKGECKYLCVVDKTNFNNIELSGVSLVSSVQKRDNTRVNKQLKYKITNSVLNGEKHRLEKPIDITVLNISAQGLYFNCEEKFEVGFSFPLIFKETFRPINLVIEIVRREEFPRSFNYGCKFVKVSEKDMDDIFRFVLKEQIAQRRKSKFF
jgi:c-di-GMP-binding flagellar brake protein YcgR